MGLTMGYLGVAHGTWSMPEATAEEDEDDAPEPEADPE
jgi:hypothetical protein